MSLNKDELDDTVIILFEVYVPCTLESSETREEVITDNIVPFLIYAKGIEAMDIRKDCSVEDIYPTITNLFGLKTDDYYKAGIDILSDKEFRLIDFNYSIKEEYKETEHCSQKILFSDYYK